MEVSGEKLLALPQAQVWQGLNDPATLRAAIPGCERIEPMADGAYRITVKAVVGPVKARFEGLLRLSDVRAPMSYTLSFEGSGGAAGFGKGQAWVELQPQAQATWLSYRVEATIGGKLAQVGARLVDGVTRRMAEEFFDNFSRSLLAAAPEPLEETAPAKAGVAVTATPSGGWDWRWWIGGWVLAAACSLALGVVATWFGARP